MEESLRLAMEESERELAAINALLEVKPAPKNQSRQNAYKPRDNIKTTFGTAKRQSATISKNSNPDADFRRLASQDRVKGGFMGKAKRNTALAKKEQTQTGLLNPSFAAVEKSVPRATISKPVARAKPEFAKKQRQVTVKTKELEASPQYLEEEGNWSDDTEASDFGAALKKAKKAWEQDVRKWAEQDPESTKVKYKLFEFSVEGSDIQYQDGPGLYNPSYDGVERKAPTAAFPKSKPKVQPKTSQIILNPDYNVTKKQPGNTVIKKQTTRNTKLLRKDNQKKLEEVNAARIASTVAVDIKAGLKPHAPSAIIPDESTYYAKPERPSPGPERYHVGYDAVEPAPKGAVKLIEDTPIVKFPVHEIGPDKYTPDDMATRANPRSAAFPKTVEQEPELDMRRALHPSDKIIKPQAPAHTIAPESIYYKAPFIEDGPAAYDINYAPVDHRVVGDVKYQQDDEEEQPPAIDYRPPLYPKTTLTHPRKPEFGYHEPTEQAPKHIPLAEIFPEEWKFYDFLKDNKFDKVPVMDFSEGVVQEDWKEHEHDKVVEKRIRDKDRGLVPIPAPGEYSPEPVEDRAPEYDFGKALGRMSPPRDVDDVDEGDMLVLETDVPPKVPMLVNMDKQIGRGYDLPEEEDMRVSLVLEPNDDPIRKRAVNLVDMDRQQGREEDKREEEQPVYILHPKHDLVEPRVVTAVDYNKQTGRPEEVPDDEMYVLPDLPVDIEPPRKVKGIPDFERETGRDIDKMEHNLDELILNPYPSPPPKSLVNMGKAQDRWVDDADEEMYDIKHPDPERGYDVLEPEPKTVNFDRYKGRDSPEVDEEIYIVNF